MIRAIPDLFRLGCFRSLWSHAGRYFKDRRVRQAFSLQPLLVGGNPLTTTAIYGLIHAMERKGGIWFCAGGTRKLVSELIALGERHGIRFHYDAKVVGLSTGDNLKLVSIESCSSTKTTRTHRCDLAVWGATRSLPSDYSAESAYLLWSGSARQRSNRRWAYSYCISELRKNTQG
jgi:phytoene dehydrogenase-like protein